MQEVTVKLQFNQPCLGNVRRKDRNDMLKDPHGRVMFLPTWWASIAAYAARVCNRHQEKIRDVSWDPIVEGSPREFKRYYAPGKFTVHEAFLPGDVIRVRAVLPDGIAADDFHEILAAAGRFRGICPFKPESRMGTFEVLEVRPVGRPPVSAAVIEPGGSVG